MRSAQAEKLRPPELELLLAAEHAVDIGARSFRQGRAHIGALIAKGDRDFATSVDLQIESAIRTSLVKAIRVGARAAPAVALRGSPAGSGFLAATSPTCRCETCCALPGAPLMTVFGIGAVVAITLALTGLIDSFNATLDASRAEALAGSSQRLTVDLAAPQPPSGATRACDHHLPGDRR